MHITALDTIKKYCMIKNGSHIIIGVSGGADSVSLLHFLYTLQKEYKIKITAVHINHGIRAEAAEDELFVKKLCEKLNVNFISYTFNIKSEAKKLSMTEEEAGRTIRYQCFYETLSAYKADKIAVAHNKNDNAETMLMRFIRGTGIKGLGGIPPIRDNIIRPLINCSREQIETYCKENNLEYKTDITNTQDTYTRNKIRLRLIPWISENMNKNIITTLSKNASIIKEEDEYLDILAEEAFSHCLENTNFACDGRTILNISKLNKYHDTIKRRIIRKACVSYSRDLHDISYRHVNMILALSDKETGSAAVLPFGLTAQKLYTTIHIYKTDKKISHLQKEMLSFSYDIMYNNVISIKETGYFVVFSDSPQKTSPSLPVFTAVLDKDKIIGKLKIRSLNSGDKIYIKGLNGRKLIKKLFSEMKIPSYKRHFYPIVCDNENVICVVGCKISDLYKINSETKNKIYLYIWKGDAL